MRVMTIEELRKHLEQQRPELPDRETIAERFNSGARIAYATTRHAFEEDIEEHLVVSAHDLAQNSGPEGVVGLMLLYMFREYIKQQKEDNREKLHKDLIQAMDQAVKEYSERMWEEYDAHTKQSTEDRASKPPETG